MLRYLSKGPAPYGTKNPCLMEFDTWGEFVAYCETAPQTPGAERQSRNDSNRHWTGDATWDETIKLAREGWTAGEKRVTSIARRLEDRITHRIVKEEWNYDVEGMTFDVSRYLQSEPEHWLRAEESTVVSAAGDKHVKIVLNGTVSYGVAPETIKAKGAVVAALVDLLEYSGQRCEVWLMFAISDRHYGKPVLAYSIRVKAYDQNLEIGRLAFALAHPATLRRLHFAVGESTDKSIVGTVGNGTYGTPVDYNELPETSLYIPASKYYGDDVAHWQNEESAEAWVLSQLAAQGVVLTDE